MENLLLEVPNTTEPALATPAASADLMELTVEQLCDVGGGTTYVLY